MFFKKNKQKNGNETPMLKGHLEGVNDTCGVLSRVPGMWYVLSTWLPVLAYLLSTEHCEERTALIHMVSIDKWLVTGGPER